MHFIIEGIPRVGKSTICEELKTLSPFYVIKESNIARDKTSMESVDCMQLAMYKSLDEALMNVHVVLDRFYPSEIVFGQDR